MHDFDDVGRGLVAAAPNSRLCIVLAGLPACGKTTLAGAIERAALADAMSVAVVRPDDITALAYAEAYDGLDAALQTADITVFDAHSIELPLRNQLHRIILTHVATPILVAFTALAGPIARNAQRSADERVPAVSMDVLGKLWVEMLAHVDLEDWHHVIRIGEADGALTATPPLPGER